MEGTERDSTQDWLLPEAAMPPTIGELEDRIEEAVTIARASETAVMSVGAAALEAANQANRAAAIAERASAVALDAQKSASQAREAELEDKVLRGFSERADRVVARLRALERRQPHPAPASVGAGRRRSVR
ncbi:MAG: hypothetical protein WB507_06640 [Solirubrobacterales bacterium]